MRPYTAILIIPTGVGAAIGGYAGDALPVARAMAEVCDVLITHPNVLNGAMLYWNLPNTLYVEGYGIDQFCQGNWGLNPVHQNKIGLIFDRGIEPDLRLRNLQVSNAARATLGLNLTDYVVTDAPLNVELRSAESGASWGTIGNPGSLLRAAESLINKTKATAIVVVARFPDCVDEETEQNYREGKGVDPIAGAEAVISHLIVREFGIPCAHAPMFTPPPLDANLSPRSAAEEIGYTFLPSVLVGLSRAPQFINRELNQNPSASDIWVNQVDAVVVPANACGSSSVLSLSQTITQIITVEENQTQMVVPPEPLGIKTISVKSYLEAIGILAARKAGVDPSILSSTIFSLQQLI